MENKAIEYHFNVIINFKQDVDVLKLSKKFKLEPYKLTMLNDSKALKGFTKCAKMWYRTKDLTNLSVHEEIEKFILKSKDYFNDLPQYLKVFDGNCHFELVFTKLDRFPIISLTQKSLEVLNYLTADFSTDFILKN